MGVDAQPGRVVTVRPAGEGDVPALGRMAAALTRMHHSYDAERFLLREPIEEGYGRWLGRVLKSPEGIVLVACQEAVVVGYVYGALEPRNWMALLDAHGALHDLYVDPSARRLGAARALVTDLTSRLRERGAPRVVLSTAAKNEEAQAFFASLGFRRTMIEMTKEL